MSRTPENEKFLKSLILGAEAAQALHKVKASVTLAQAILESGWGKSALTKKANNLFGIKADKAWKGPTILMPTTEYYRGHKQTVDAFFRRYLSLADSIKDHALFLKKNPRYKAAFDCPTGIEFAKTIAECGYATDPGYAQLLISLIKQHNLEQYDV